jgi:hypothetical protein
MSPNGSMKLDFVQRAPTRTVRTSHLHAIPRVHPAGRRIRYWLSLRSNREEVAMPSMQASNRTAKSSGRLLGVPMSNPRKASIS